MPVLTILGELEAFTTEHLYSYRYVITPVLIAALLVASYIAYRRGLHQWIWRHRLASIAVGIPLVLVTYLGGDYFLSPLWERTTLNEASPLAAEQASVGSDASGSTDATGSPADGATETPESQLPSAVQATVVSSGAFAGSDDFHFGRGDALIIETEPGRYVLRVENFSVRNGPDLFVYLSEDPTGGSVNETFNLGALKATDGAFNYEIPPSIDLSRVRSAVVWCRQFEVLFAHAELTAE